MKKIIELIFLVFIVTCILMSINSCKVYATEEGEVENGIYRIKTAQNPNIVFDIEGASKTYGAGLGLWHNFYSMNQEFIITKLNDGSFEIKARHSGLVLDIYNNSKSEGTVVEQFINFNQDNQKFFIEPTDDGYYNIRCKHSNLYLDVSEGSAKAGTRIKTYKKNGGITQNFILEKVEPLQGSKTIESGCYQILLNADRNMAVTIENASKDYGANVLLKENCKAVYQRFNINYLENGYYTISAVHSGKLLDNYNNDKGTGTNIIQYVANGGDNQKWIIKQNEDGSYYILSKSNELYLSTALGKADGTNIYGHSQIIDEEYRKFVFVPVEEKKSERVIEDGIYKIKSSINSNLSLDIEGVSKNNGANLELWNNNSGENQIFFLKYVDGYYTIIASNSNKAIDVYNGNLVPNTNVIQWEKNKGKNQQWIIEKTSDGYYKFCSRNSEMYLMSEVSPKNGSNIFVGAELENGNNQKFLIEKVELDYTKIEESSYKIVPYINILQYLDVTNASTAESANVGIWINQRRKNQIYDIEYIDDESFKIVACHSQKVLTVKGENVEQKSYTGEQEQLWKAHQNDDGSFYIVSNKEKLFLTVDGNGSSGNNICVKAYNGTNAQKFFMKRITDGSSGTYGNSGLVYAGDSRGQSLPYYQYGCGENVYYATFEVHGFEDNWNWDGYELKYIAEQFYNRLLSDKNLEIAKNWTIYIFPTVNPDGLNHGYTNNGPGRTTFYSSAPTHKGMDINRTWQTEGSYKEYTGDRNYNGTSGFQAYEAAALRNFMLNHKSTTGRTIVVDLHGWENSLIGSTNVLSYFANYFPDATKKYEHYGQQYLITWGRYVLGADVGLVELPTWIKSHNDVINADLAGKYIQSCYDMLNNEKNKVMITMENANSVTLGGIEERKLDEFAIAVAGAINHGNPSKEQIDDYKDLKIDAGVYIIPGYEEKILEVINSVCDNEFGTNSSNFLVIKNESMNKNKYDLFFESLINSDNTYLFSMLGELYCRDEVSKVVTSNIYEFMDKYQTYDYAQYGNKMLIDIPKNDNKLIENKEIVDSLIELIKEK